MLASLLQVQPSEITGLSSWYVGGVWTVIAGLLVYLITVQWPRWMIDARAERDVRDATLKSVVEKLELGFATRNTEILLAIKNAMDKLSLATERNSEMLVMITRQWERDQPKQYPKREPG